MFEKFQSKTATATVAALAAALSVGGVALAQSGGVTTPNKAPAKVHTTTGPKSEAPGQESNAPENSAADPDNVQQGDAGTTTDKPESATDRPDGAADAPESANDRPDGATDTLESANDRPDAGEESGSEVVNDDGPGGHADEPGNPHADHHARGQQ